MAEVKWIKIVTDIFDNRKIKLIRKMPEGSEIVVTWFQLLCLAGETNDNGLIYVTKAIPYTEETLATAFDTPLPIVRLALDTFQQLEMITVYNSFLCVTNWEKYQNVDGLTKIREQTRKRVANHRAKQKELSSCNVTVTLPVTHCNATEEEIEEDKERDIDKELISNGDLSAFFESIWALYPRKKGKGSVSDTQKKKLYKIGFDELRRCINRYLADLKKETWRKQKDGSTFFNSGYVDYLDKNYEPPKENEQGQDRTADQRAIAEMDRLRAFMDKEKEREARER